MTTCRKREAEVYLSAIDPKESFLLWTHSAGSVEKVQHISTQLSRVLELTATEGRGSCISKARILTLLFRYNQELAFSKEKMLNMHEYT